MYVPCIFYSLFTRQTNAQHIYIYINNNLYLVNTHTRSRDRFPVMSLRIFSVDHPDGTMCPEVDSASESDYKGFILG